MKRYETPTYQYVPPNYETAHEEKENFNEGITRAQVHNRERGLRHNGLTALANYQMVAHNPQSTLHRVTAGNFNIQDSLRGYLDTDAQTVMQLRPLTERFLDGLPNALVYGAVDKTVREPFPKLFLKRNREKMKREMHEGFMNPTNYKEVMKVDRLIRQGGAARGRMVNRPERVYRKKHAVSYKTKVENRVMNRSAQQDKDRKHDVFVRDGKIIYRPRGG